jgi:hypothetical protein
MMHVELSKKNLVEKGNVSLATGVAFSIQSMLCPCPICIGTTVVCFLNAACEKLGVSLPFLKRFQD